MPVDPAEIRNWIAENASFEARNGRKAVAGHHVRADIVTGADELHSMLFLDHYLTKQPGESRGKLEHTVMPGIVPAPRLAHLVRGTMLALVELMDVAWCAAYAASFGDTSPTERARRVYQSGWMVYVDATHAAHLAPVDMDGIVVETMPTGGVMMSVACESFNPRHPGHLAAAGRIAEALAPLEPHFHD